MAIDFAQYQKERNKTLKEMHRCRRCGIQDPRTLSGKSLCEECEKKHVAEQLNYIRNNAEAREKMASKAKQRYEALKAEHKCVACCSIDTNTLAGHILCVECYTRQKKSKIMGRRRKKK